MKRIALIVCLLAVSVASFSQNAGGLSHITADEDYNKTARQLDYIPYGWKVRPLPVLGFNSDLGFIFGAFADIYDYGTSPTLFPDYRHKITVQASGSTGGQILTHVDYDSKTLIPGVRLTSVLTYQFDPLYSFYGINGDVNEYHNEWDRRDEYAWYSYKRNMVRFMNTFQGKIVSKLYWLGGLNYYFYKNDRLTFEKYADSPTLYDEYFKRGILGDADTKGNVMELVGGMIWDSRDQGASPRKGIWAEVLLHGSADIFGTGYNYLKLTAKFRHYFTPFKKDWLTVAYQLAYQGVIAGEQPFYILQNMYGSKLLEQYNEGFGGAATLRGVMQSKLLGDGYAWANIELRFRIAKCKWLGQNWSFGLNPFFDAGAIVQTYRLEQMVATDPYGRSLDELKQLAMRAHLCAGLGFKMIMADYFVFSLEWGKSFRKEDGPSMVSLSVNYIF